MAATDLAGPLVWLALLALPIHALRWPSVQPAELLALPLLAWAGARLLGRQPRPEFSVVDKGVLAWTSAVFFAAGVHWLRTGALPAPVAREAAVSLYLACLYFAVRIACRATLVETALRAMVVSFGIAAVLGASGWLAAELGKGTPLAFAADTAYPYLGRAARATALSATPNMLAGLLGLALLLLAAGAVPALSRRARIAAALSSSLGLALTFSKTAIATAAGLIVVRALSRVAAPAPGPRGVARARYAVAAAACLLLALGYAALSHLVLLHDDRGRAQLEDAMFVAGPPLFALEVAGRRFEAYPTNYYFNKRASALAVARSWPWGIGPGRHPAFAGSLKGEGLYPQGQWLGVPHSSYTGALAELGLAGCLGLLGFLVALGRGIGRLLGRGQDPFAVAAAGFFVMLLIEASATDVMHYRHLFWMAALVAARLQSGPPVNASPAPDLARRS